MRFGKYELKFKRALTKQRETVGMSFDQVAAQLSRFPTVREIYPSIAGDNGHNLIRTWESEHATKGRMPRIEVLPQLAKVLDLNGPHELFPAR